MEEEGCAFYDLICHGKSLVGAGVESVAGGALEAAAGAMMAGADAVLNALGTFWLRPDFVDLPTNSDVSWLQSSLAPFVTVAVVVSVLIAGGQIIWTQRGAPLKELGKSLAIVVTVSGTGLLALGLLIDAGNEFSVWIIESSGETGFSDLIGRTLSSPVAGMGFMLIGAVVAIVVGAGQIMALFVRSAMLVLLASVLPLATAATNTAWGREWARKLLGWTVAFILFKPVAAIVIALGLNLLADEAVTPFEDLVSSEIARLGCDASSQDCQKEAVANVLSTMISSNGDGGLTRFLMGLVILVASLLTLPALMRFIMPATASLGSGGGGLGAALGGAAMMATGVMASGAVSAKLRSGGASGSSVSASGASSGGGGGPGGGASSSAGATTGSGSATQQVGSGPPDSGDRSGDGAASAGETGATQTQNRSGAIGARGDLSGPATTGTGSQHVDGGSSGAAGAGTGGRQSSSGQGESASGADTMPRHDMPGGAGVVPPGGRTPATGSVAALRGMTEAAQGSVEDAVGDGSDG